MSDKTMSIHKQAIRQQVNKLMGESAEWCQILSDYLSKLQNGFFGQEYQDSILQKWERFDYDIYDAYTFCQVHYMICSGSLATALVEKGVTPRGDKEVDYHNSILSKTDDSPFSGKYWGGLADCDGHFAWDVPLEFEVKHGGLGDEDLKRRSVVIQPNQVPLEVGYTEGSRTWLHLVWEGGLARWPYNSTAIHVFVVTDRTKLGLYQLAASHEDRYAQQHQGLGQP